MIYHQDYKIILLNKSIFPFFVGISPNEVWITPVTSFSSGCLLLKESPLPKGTYKRLSFNYQEHEDDLLNPAFPSKEAQLFSYAPPTFHEVTPKCSLPVPLIAQKV